VIAACASCRGGEPESHRLSPRGLEAEPTSAALRKTNGPSALGSHTLTNRPEVNRTTGPYRVHTLEPAVSQVSRRERDARRADPQSHRDVQANGIVWTSRECAPRAESTRRETAQWTRVELPFRSQKGNAHSPLETTAPPGPISIGQRTHHTFRHVDPNDLLRRLRQARFTTVKSISRTASPARTWGGVKQSEFSDASGCPPCFRRAYFFEGGLFVVRRRGRFPARSGPRQRGWGLPACDRCSSGGT
jgi:hypothetical protein